MTIDDPTTPATAPEPELSLTTKIALIEGERFSVPYDTPLERIRENLAAIYPGIRTATASTGTLTLGDVRYESIEFTKQAGTKGADAPNPLLPLLGLPRRPGALIPIAHFHGIRLLRRGSLTVEEALDMPMPPTRSSSSSAEVRLCQILDALTTVAVAPDVAVPGWSA